MLVELAKDETARRALAHNPRAPAALLAELVRDGLARHPNTPPEVLAALADDNDVWIRRSVAAHPGTPPAVLARLAQTNDPALHRALNRRWALRGTRAPERAETPRDSPPETVLQPSESEEGAHTPSGRLPRREPGTFGQPKDGVSGEGPVLSACDGPPRPRPPGTLPAQAEGSRSVRLATAGTVAFAVNAA